jgi:hypothetical protein
LEAVGGKGVVCKKFSSLPKHVGKFYAKIATRKVQFERTDEILDIVDDFTAEADGQPYKIDFSKIKNMKKKTKVFKETSDRKYVDENRSFMCAELVAKAWKTC